MVVVPQTLFDADRSLPRITVVDAICHLSKCGSQYASNPTPKEYRCIEVLFFVRPLQLKHSTLAIKALDINSHSSPLNLGPTSPARNCELRDRCHCSSLRAKPGLYLRQHSLWESQEVQSRRPSTQW